MRRPWKFLLATLAALAAAPPGVSRAQNVSVPGQQPWTDTGVNVASGTQLTIQASGVIRFFAGDQGKTPDGDPNCVAPGGFLAPGLHCYALVARIGGGTPFEVGSSDTLISQTAGRLYLGPNDNSFTDNSGSWFAQIQGTGQFPAAGWWAPSAPAVLYDDRQASGLVISWVASYVYPYSGVPGSWYLSVVYQNRGKQPLAVDCAGQADTTAVRENIQGSNGGVVSAMATHCSREPSFRTTLAPGASFEGWAVFSFVPRTGARVSLEWGGRGQSPYVDPFARSFNATPPAEQP